MIVTAVHLRTDLLERPGSRLVACGSVELDGELRIEYVRVVRTGDGRLLVAMPQRQNNVGSFRDTVHPIVPRLRALINAAVLAECERHLTKAASTGTLPAPDTTR